MVKFTPGEAYYLKFWDHCTGVRTPLQCEFLGWCIEDQEGYAVFSAWLADRDPETNTEPVVILKSAITQIKFLKEVPK